MTEAGSRGGFDVGPLWLSLVEPDEQTAAPIDAALATDTFGLPIPTTA